MTSLRSMHLHNSVLNPLILACIIGIALSLHLWGIRRDLPFTPEVDEPSFVTPAVRIAASGDPNPGWFGHPGSTVIYPLAAVYRVWHAVAHGGMLFHSDHNLQLRFDSSPSEFYLLGRLLSISYAVMSVPLVYLVGRKAFGEQVGLIGSWLFMLYPIAVEYAQTVRTDSASVFFGLLSLWLCLRLYDRPTIGSQILAGFAVGLAIATKFTMAALVPILLVVEEVVLWRQASRAQDLKATWLGVHVGVLAVAIAFVLSTPFFFLDFRTAARDLVGEARSTHLGADGLSIVGNLLWYLMKAIPQNITWLQMMLAAIGVALVLWRREARQMLLLGFLSLFFVGISFLRLHVERWIIPMLPLFSLLAADALNASITYVSKRLRLKPSFERGLIFSALLLVSVWPAYQLVLSGIGLASPSTRVLAREWIVQNLPTGSHIAQEWYTAPLATADFYGYASHDRYTGPLLATSFVLFERFSLATDHTLEDYCRDGYQYLVTSSYVYQRFLREPNRHPSEAAFYRRLFSEGNLLQQFEPSTTREGPVIRIYELRGR